MREILFKAKRIDNGEWVEGYLAKAKWYYDEKEMIVILPTDLCIYPHCEFSEWFEIDKKTICQYTGLTDKNGNKIWENDILDCQDRITIVKWNIYCGTWDCDFVRYKGKRCSNGINVADWKYRAKVIGNIFDNPELAKENEHDGIGQGY